MSTILEFDEEKHQYKVDGKIVPSVTDICAPLTMSKYGSIPALAASAAHRGTIVHELCELYDYGALPDEIPADALPYLSAWISFCNDYNPTWHFIEHRMGYFEYAGTADRIGVIDGNPCIVDIKTTSSLDKLSKISLSCQLWGYTALFVGNAQNWMKRFRPAGVCEMFTHSFGVQLLKDGNYRIYRAMDISNTYSLSIPDTFKSLLNIARITRR